MTKKLPILPIFVDAYQHDTSHLSLAEHGAYLTLMMEAWKRPNTDLPDDDKMLARLLRVSIEEWLNVKPAIMEFWSFDGRSRTWVQKRLKKEKMYVQKVRMKKRDAAAKRWNKSKNANAGGDAGAMQPPPPQYYPYQEEEHRGVGDTRETPFDEPPLRVVGGADDA